MLFGTVVRLERGRRIIGWIGLHAPSINRFLVHLVGGRGKTPM